MRARIRITFYLLAVGLAVISQNVSADEVGENSIRLLGVGKIAGTTLDLSGMSDELVPVEGTSSDEVPEGRRFFNNMFGGISAITWSGKENVYWMLPDRGPLDGAVNWTCRVQKVRIFVDPKGEIEPIVKPLETVILRDQRGVPFTGIASAFRKTESMTRRLDPEGIRVANNGNLFISDEYGPRILEFTPGGQFVQELDVPDRYLIANPDVSKKTENPKNETGRGTNRGMEGLAIAEDGLQMFGLMQSPLLQDSFRETIVDKPMWLNCRVPSFDVHGNFGTEYVYQLDEESNKLNEILSCGGDSQFVVIERDGESGAEAKFKKLMLISTESATDVSSVKALPRSDLPSQILPVSKTVLLDLLDQRWGLLGDQMPEKIEGLAFGPDLGEYRLLLVASDNDFIPTQPTVIYAFAIRRSVFDRSDR